MGTFVLHRRPIRHNSKSYDYENKTKTGKNQKFSIKVREEKIEANWKHKLFSEKFIFDQLNVFWKPIEAVNFMTSWWERLMRKVNEKLMFKKIFEELFSKS